MIRKQKIDKIGFIGSGRVATHLAVAMYEAGLIVSKIYSPDYNHATILANKVNSQVISSLKELSDSIDLIIIAINDSAISSLDLSVIRPSIMICHTSGSTSMNILKNRLNYGVFYPLQSFSFDNKPNWKEIPICIEANTAANVDLLKQVAKKLSNSIYEINSEERSMLHIAAVFVSNFTNAMYSIGEDILDKGNISLDILHPLIAETANKVKYSSPKETQTGPAIRNDNLIINKHIQQLQQFADYADIYKRISKIIQKQQNSR